MKEKKLSKRKTLKLLSKGKNAILSEKEFNELKAMPRFVVHKLFLSAIEQKAVNGQITSTEAKYYLENITSWLDEILEN